MSLVFSYRSNTLTAYYAPGGEGYTWLDQAAGGVTGLCQIVDYDSQSQTLTGWIGDKALHLNAAGINTYVSWNGIQNTPKATAGGVWIINYRMAQAQTYSGALFLLGGYPNSDQGRFSVQYLASGLLIGLEDELSGMIFNNDTIGSVATIDPLVSNYQAHDWTFRVKNTTSGLEIDAFVDGNSVGSLAPAANRYYIPTRILYMWDRIAAGGNSGAHTSAHYVNEMLIFDSDISDASIASYFTGPSRTEFWSTTALQPINSTDPGVANVVGVSYTFKGQSLTGSYSTPTYTDPGIANVASGVGYTFNDSSLTGTLSVPTASTGPAGTVPLGELKEQVRYALFVNNTSTGAPTHNLSENLSRRVRSVLKVNPDRLGPPDDNVLPAVTVFTEDKAVEQVTIARNQLTGKRRATVNLKVMGMVWEPYTTNRKADPGDDQCEYLMENIERILRAYDTLGGNVQWHIPSQVTYHSFQYGEDSHFRAGILDLQTTLYY